MGGARTLCYNATPFTTVRYVCADNFAFQAFGVLFCVPAHLNAYVTSFQSIVTVAGLFRNANSNHLMPYCTASTDVNSRFMSNNPASASGQHPSSTEHHPSPVHRIAISRKTKQCTAHVSTCLAKYPDYVSAGPPNVTHKPADNAVQNAVVLPKVLTPLESFALSHPFGARLASTGGLHWRHCPGGPDAVQDSVVFHSLRAILLQAAAGASIQPSLLCRDHSVTRRAVCRSA